MRASLIIISWRDIPAQVVGKRGRESARAALSARFQEAVDRAAMRAGKGSSHAYLTEWKRSDPRPCEDDIHAAVSAEIAKLEAHYTDDDLERLIRSRGLDTRAADDSGAAQTEPAPACGAPGGEGEVS